MVLIFLEFASIPLLLIMKLSNFLVGTREQTFVGIKLLAVMPMAIEDFLQIVDEVL